MRLTALRGRASFSFAPVVVTVHCSAAPETTAARTVRYNFNARPKQSKPGPRFEVDAGTRTSNMLLQYCSDGVDRCRNADRCVAEVARETLAIRRDQRPAVIFHHVIRVLQQMPG